MFYRCCIKFKNTIYKTKSDLNIFPPYLAKRKQKY